MRTTTNRFTRQHFERLTEHTISVSCSRHSSKHLLEHTLWLILNRRWRRLHLRLLCVGNSISLVLSKTQHYCKQSKVVPHLTSNATGRHRGPKQNLRLLTECRRYNGRHMLRCVIIVECGIAHFLCAMRVLEVKASSSSPRLPLCQILFISWPKLLS